MDRYSLRIELSDFGIAFSGYFTAIRTNATRQVITAVYDNSFPGRNVLLPKTDSVYDEADNLYFKGGSFSYDGTNIVIDSTALQAWLGSRTNHYNLFLNLNGISKIWFETPSGGRYAEVVTFFITPLNKPSIRIRMGSLYTNNAQVYYKPHSLSSGSGGVRNFRAKRIRT